jgi:hypothetical protein
MRLTISGDTIEMSGDDGALAGRYVYEDAYKPYLHPLLTPSGVAMSAFMPHDHKHHRALMYALRTEDVNFWEERSTLPGERVGRQVHRGLSEVVEAGAAVSFTQALDWCEVDSDEPIFRETRLISCTTSPHGRAFAWTWSTRIVVERDLTLRMSQWSSARPDGRLVNYHGLGLRLPREFGGGMARPRVAADSAATDIMAALGTTPRELEYVSAADGYWPIRHAGVRFTQGQDNGLFIMKDPFAYISLGPSNLAPLELKRGATIEERYGVEVFDADPPAD